MYISKYISRTGGVLGLFIGSKAKSQTVKTFAKYVIFYFLIILSSQAISFYINIDTSVSLVFL